jgi:hypothetical protein
MIPISRDTIFKWEDAESDIVFEIAPALGDNELLMYSVLNTISSDVTPFLAEAEKIVDADSGGKRWRAGQRVRAIREKATELANVANKKTGKDSFDIEEMRSIYKVIDCFVIACTPSGGKRVEFDGNASQSFNLLQNTRLLNGIMKVNNLTGEERKN